MGGRSRLAVAVSICLAVLLAAFAGSASAGLPTVGGGGAASGPADGGLPPVGTSAEDADLRSIPGATSFEGQTAVPLAAERPAWLTDELYRETLAADGEPVAAPNDAPLPSEVGIRPGGWMIAPYGCTMNFVFSKSGALGIGTAGHCVDKVGDEVVLLTLAPGGENPVLVYIGDVIARHDNGIGDDFALVEIKPELYPWVSATTALIGGPCGSYYGFGPETVAHVGHGLVIGTGGTPRAGVALTWRDDAFGWDGAAIFGDSGSPVRVTDLKAAGDLTHLVVNRRWLPSFIAGTRIGKMLQIANGWSLADSPLCLSSGGGGDGGGEEPSDGGGGKPDHAGGGNGQGKGPKK